MRSSTLTVTTNQSTYLATQPLNQCSSTNAVSQMSSFGFFLLLLLIGCFYFKRWSQKRCQRPVLDDHQQQIERLEKILKMTAHPEL